MIPLIFPLPTCQFILNFGTAQGAFLFWFFGWVISKCFSFPRMIVITNAENYF